MIAPSASWALGFGFAALSVAMAGLLWWALRRVGAPKVARALGVWLAVTGGLAGAGVLAHFHPLPRLAPMLLVGLGLTLWLVLSDVGRRLALQAPLWALIGVHVFRLPVELLLHQGALEGVVPTLLTWEGRNFDIAVPLLAGPLAVWAADGRLPRAVAWAFAVGGLGLVLNVVVHAVLAMPGPLQMIQTVPANTWVAHWPFVWLPALLVPIAIGGQALLIRRLLNTPR